MVVGKIDEREELEEDGEGEFYRSFRVYHGWGGSRKRSR